jgi:serine/threonine protein kinase
MPVLNTIDELLQTIGRSGLLERPRLDAHLHQLTGEGPLPDQPAALARLLVRDGLLTAFQANLLLAGKWQGFVLLGKYKLMDVIGSGGMGKVFLCEHMMLRRLVAVKVLPRAKTENPLAVERFYREARAVAALDHPNIVRAFDVDRDGMLHFLIMEYVDGSSLETVVSMHGPMDIGRAAHYIRQAALGLQHAHQAGWVHRDIKPANILLARDGTIKILDMGLARLFTDDNDNLTKQHGENAVLGTADYIAPEQAVSSHEVDIRADIYSLGGTFYFLLTGQPPFHEGSMAQKLIWHQMRQPKSVLALRPEVPPDLAAIVARMLAKDPNDRFATPGELAEALLPIAPPSAPPPPDKEMPRKDPPNLGGVAPPRDAVGFASIKSLMLDSPSGAKPHATPVRAPLRTLMPAETPSKPNVKAGATVLDSAVRLAPPPGGRILPPEADPARATFTPSGTPTEMGTNPAPRKPGVFLPALVVGLLLAVFAGAGAYYLFFARQPGTPTTTALIDPTPGVETPVLRVTRITTSPWYGKPNSFSTVREALRAAKPGDHILLIDPDWAEVLAIDAKLAKNVTLRADAPTKDRRAVWRLPTDRQSREDGKSPPPILTLTNVEGLRIQNIVFDGEGYPADLTAVTGACPGLKMERVDLTGFSRAALRFQDCEGDSTYAAEFKQLRIYPNRTKGAENAILFDGGADRRIPAWNRYLLFNECRFEGPYTAGAVHVKGSVTNTDFTRNRFYNAGAAFTYADADPLPHMALTISANTFYNVTTAFQFKTLPAVDVNKPPAEQENLLRLRNNLFCKVPALVRLGVGKGSEEDLKKLFENAGAVVDKASGLDGSGILTAKRLEFELEADPNPAKDGSFLRYPGTSQLAAAGADGQPVGCPPPASSP